MQICFEDAVAEGMGQNMSFIVIVIVLWANIYIYIFIYLFSAMITPRETVFNQLVLIS